MPSYSSLSPSPYIHSPINDNSFQPICVLAENKDDVGKFASFSLSSISSAPSPAAAAAAPVAEESKPVAAPAATSTPASSASDRVFVSPLAKVMAAEKGINLASVKGSGPDGRVIKADIENYKGILREQVLMSG